MASTPQIGSEGLATGPLGGGDAEGGAEPHGARRRAGRWVGIRGSLGGVSGEN